MFEDHHINYKINFEQNYLDFGIFTTSILFRIIESFIIINLQKL